MICGSGGSKSRLAVRSQLARWEMKNCTPLWREAHVQVKKLKTPHVRNTFWSWDVEKVHTVVARSKFASEKAKNTRGSDHFWKLRFRKSARSCGAKQISKSKCAKHTVLGPLSEIEMSKKCTSLWREAHFEVKMLKTLGVRTTFGRWDVDSRGRCKGLYTLSKVSKTWGLCSMSNYNHHYTTLHLHYIPLHYTTHHSTTLHSITLNYITLHYTTFHYTTLHYTTLRYITLHYTTFHYTALHYTPLHYTTTTLHNIPLQYTPLHYTQLHYTTLHSTTLHYTTLNYTTLHYTTLHSTTVHYTTLNTTATTTTTILHLHNATLHYTNFATLRSTTLHFTEWHCTTPTTAPTTTTATATATATTTILNLHNATLHYTNTKSTQRYTTLH